MKHAKSILARRLMLLLTGSAVALTPALTPAGLFGPKGDSIPEKRSEVRKQRDQMLGDLYANKPDLKAKVRRAAGYATFNQKDINLFLLASGNGYGVVVNNKTGQETFMRVASLGGGLGLGVKDLRVVFIFNDPKVMEQFVASGWQFGGKADAAAKYKDTGVSAEQNVKANVDFKAGTVAAGSSTDARASAGDTKQAGLAVGGPMEIYQFTESGLSLQATVAGTKYWKDGKLNQASAKSEK
jgi:lipid-binding SYLF domain-containing protein